MTETLAGGQPADYRELARRVRSHPFVDGPTRKLVRSWIGVSPLTRSHGPRLASR
jgi:hypothetical protein